MMNREETNQLLEFVKRATSPFHTILAAKEILDKHGFTPLKRNESWKLEKGKSYYIEYYGTSLFAFRVGKNYKAGDGLRISAAHGDFPALRIKAKPEIVCEKSAQLNVEVYGGAILNTWLDRPLSAAGRVAIKSDDVFHPEVRFVDFKKPFLIIPNLAIHYNRDVNKGVELNPQNHMMPLVGMVKSQLEKDQYFIKYLAKELEVEPEDILDYELNIYNLDEGMYVGIEEDLISSPRLDDLTSAHAVIEGILEDTSDRGICISAIFDHEEVGSRSKQGGGSAILSLLVQKVLRSLGTDEETYMNTLDESVLISMDVAHGIHPNYVNKSDVTNKAYLNDGFCIKVSSSQSYATDSEAIGIVQQICEKEQIPYQKIANRSDVRGGGTLGPIVSALLPIRTIDLGIPLLAMHSSRELMGVEDHVSLIRFIKAFYRL